MSNNPKEFPAWMPLVMRIAGVYNLIWGAWVILFPQQFFALCGMETINHPVVWQGMGMVIGVYGIGYWFSAINPIRHWIIIAVGFLGKLFGPAGFVVNYFLGEIPASFGYTLLTNDLIWWIPFALILKKAYQVHQFKQ